MSLDVKPEERVSRAIRRIGRKRIDKSLETLTAARSNGNVSDEAIHQVRRHLKQVRALLRLARGELGGKRFRRENTALRDAGRPLSEVRDATVMLETLEGLAKDGPRHLPFGTTARIRRALSNRQEKIRQRMLSDEHRVRVIERALRKASRRVPTWTLKHRGWKALEPGLRRIYARGRDALMAANREGSDEALHRLRKRTKDFRYSLELLVAIEPATIGSLARTAHRFTDCLGEDHDLAILQALLQGELRGDVPSRTRRQLRDPVAGKRANLQKVALAMGDRLYKEGEDAFIKRMHGHWKTWRRSRHRQ